MRSVRQDIGGLGNLMFKQAYLWSQMRDGVIPDVYVQDEKYFDKYKEEVRQMFSNGITDKSIDRVAVHFRRGDYLKASQFHLNLWQTDYYQKALALFPDSKFLVFCKDNQDPMIDAADREWCITEMTRLVGDRFEMRESGTETEDLNAMASCEALIMANSTFSWWAAWLGNHTKIICPEKWFTDGIQRCGLLDKWIKV
jgi:hypothetical protein